MGGILYLHFMYYSIVLLFVILLSSCGNKKSDNIPDHERAISTIQINLDEAVDELKMSEFFSSLKYVRLNPPAGHLIGSIRKILIGTNYLGFYDRPKQSVWIFSHSGEYINEVVIPKGRGPGELENVTDVILSDDGKVHALGAFKVVAYDLEGNFLEEADYRFRIYRFSYNLLSGEYIGYASNSMNSAFNSEHAGKNLIYFDRSGKITKSSLPIGTGKEQIGFGIPNNFPKFKENQLFFSHLVDTVYSFQNRKFVPAPRYILDYGHDSIPKEVFERRKNYSTVRFEWRDFWTAEIADNNYVAFLSAFNETESFIHLNFGTLNEQYNAFYNKRSGETKIGPGKFTNDIDYGFVPFMYESSDDALYTIIEANDLLRRLNEVYENEPEKYHSPQMRHLVQLGQSLSDNSNPILQIAAFKTGEEK